MSWHGPSAPRVEGIATKSRVVLSWASKPASTASRIRWLSLAFMMVPLSHQQTITCDEWTGDPPFRIAGASLHCEFGKTGAGRRDEDDCTHPALMPAVVGLDDGSAGTDQSGRARTGHRRLAAWSARDGGRRYLSPRPDQGSVRRQDDGQRRHAGAQMRAA